MQMVFKPASSGTRSAEVYIARRRVNDAFLRDLIRDWEAHGAEVLAQVRREQPGTYMKVMAMLMPKEMKVETAHTTISSLTDEQLQAMIHELQERIAAKLSGGEAKVINPGAATDLTALPHPANEAPRAVTSGRKHNPKSSPERLVYAREYKRQRKAGNPNAAAAARTAVQAAKTTDERTPTPAS
jgi:hypothetical protein